MKIKRIADISSYQRYELMKKNEAIVLLSRSSSLKKGISTKEVKITDEEETVAKNFPMKNSELIFLQVEPGKAYIVGNQKFYIGEGETIWILLHGATGVSIMKREQLLGSKIKVIRITEDNDVIEELKNLPEPEKELFPPKIGGAITGVFILLVLLLIVQWGVKERDLLFNAGVTETRNIDLTDVMSNYNQAVLRVQNYEKYERQKAEIARQKLLSDPSFKSFQTLLQKELKLGGKKIKALYQMKKQEDNKVLLRLVMESRGSVFFKSEEFLANVEDVLAITGKENWPIKDFAAGTYEGQGLVMLSYSSLNAREKLFDVIYGFQVDTDQVVQRVYNRSNGTIMLREDVGGLLVGGFNKKYMQKLYIRNGVLDFDLVMLEEETQK